MRALIGVLLAVALSLAACQTHITTLPHKPGKTSESQGPSAPVPSATTPAVTNGPITVDLLQPPVGDAIALTGTVHIDASYLVAAGAGSIVAAGGGNIVAAGGGNIIAQGGGNIVAAGGGNIIAQGGGNVIGINGGNIIAQGGGNIIAAGGGNVIPGNASGLTATQGGAIVATGGGNIVAAGGGNIVAQGGGNFGLLAAGVASPTPAVTPANIPVGTILAGVGLLVSAVSLESHQYVPVGTNAKGQPVYVVYSNASGAYKLFLPKAQEGNVLVVATVPQTGDEHLVYNAFTPLAQSPTSGNVDEDTVIATRLVRFAFTERMVQILTATDLTQTINYILDSQTHLGTGDASTSPLNLLLSDVVTKYSRAARELGVPTGPAAARNPVVHELAQLITDYALGSLDYPSLLMTGLYAPTWAAAGGPPEQAYEALGKSMKALREATLAKQLALGGKDVRIPVSVFTTPDQSLSCTSVIEVPVSKATDYGNYLTRYFLAANKLDTISNTRRFYRALVPQTIYSKGGEIYKGEPGTLPAVLDAHGETMSDAAGVTVVQGFDQDHLPLQDPSLYDDGGKQLHHDLRIEAASYTILGAQLLQYRQADLFARIKVRMKDYCDHHSFKVPVATPDPNAPVECVPTPTPVPQR